MVARPEESFDGEDAELSLPENCRAWLNALDLTFEDAVAAFRRKFRLALPIGGITSVFFLIAVDVYSQVYIPDEPSPSEQVFFLTVDFVSSAASTVEEWGEEAIEDLSAEK
jgi:hypothetical protein